MTSTKRMIQQAKTADAIAHIREQVCSPDHPAHWTPATFDAFAAKVRGSTKPRRTVAKVTRKHELDTVVEDHGSHRLRFQAWVPAVKDDAGNTTKPGHWQPKGTVRKASLVDVQFPRAVRCQLQVAKPLVKGAGTVTVISTNARERVLANGRTTVRFVGGSVSTFRVSLA